jgi:hypothetical protein
VVPRRPRRDHGVAPLSETHRSEPDASPAASWALICAENLDNGVAAFAGSQQNQIAYNKVSNNTPVDCYDETTGGGTAGTANFWSRLCKSKS